MHPRAATLSKETIGPRYDKPRRSQPPRQRAKGPEPKHNQVPNHQTPGEGCTTPPASPREHPLQPLQQAQPPLPGLLPPESRQRPRQDRVPPHKGLCLDRVHLDFSTVIPIPFALALKRTPHENLFVVPICAKGLRHPESPVSHPFSLMQSRANQPPGIPIVRSRADTSIIFLLAIVIVAKRDGRHRCLIFRVDYHQ